MAFCLCSEQADSIDIHNVSVKQHQNCSVVAMWCFRDFHLSELHFASDNLIKPLNNE